MNRRGFLGGLLALAAPAIIRTPGLLMPVRMLSDDDDYDDDNYDIDSVRSGLLTPGIITRETLRLFESNLIQAGRVNDQFARKFGGLLNIRRPTSFALA